MSNLFHRATKTQSKLRMALYGVSGSGKTFSALAIAKGLGGRVAVELEPADGVGRIGRCEWGRGPEGYRGRGEYRRSRGTAWQSRQWAR